MSTKITISDLPQNDPFVASTEWTKESSSEETICFLTRLATAHASQAGPFRDPISTYVENGDWRGLLGYGISYQHGSPDHLYHARQALAFFEKLECLPLGVDRRAVAFEKFEEAEERCLETNHRLRAMRRGEVQPPPRVASVIHTAQRKITRVLGDVPSLDQLKLSFGPGANTTVKATASSARWKLNAQPACSPNCVGAIEPLLRALPHYAAEHRSPTSGLLRQLEDHCDNFTVPVQITHGKLQFVPKNAKTFRSIVVEPVLNSIAQKGIGCYIKDCLRSIGIDIATQSERNKKLAQRGSFDGSLATIDLSAASDTISYEVVSELLPLDWFCFLRTFRTGTVLYDGNEINLQKFSSMGNAFTFELETLIFWAIACACAELSDENTSDVCAFGDDIIIPTGATPLLFEALSFLGFTVNSEKSYWDGPFRESCGGDYVKGIDIRPFYMKDRVSGRTLFILHNYYVRTLQLEMASIVLEAIPISLRIWGPDGYGDGHLIGSWSHTARSSKKIRESGYGGVIFDTFSLKPRYNFSKCQRGDRVLPLYSIYVQGDSGDPTTPSSPYVVRGSRGYRRLSIYTLSTGVLIP